MQVMAYDGGGSRILEQRELKAHGLTLFTSIRGPSIDDVKAKASWAEEYGRNLYNNDVEITNEVRHTENSLRDRMSNEIYFYFAGYLFFVASIVMRGIMLGTTVKSTLKNVLVFSVVFIFLFYLDTIDIL